ncbi:MAG: ExbD/TolR family protein [Phycisphaerales bacterium]
MPSPARQRPYHLQPNLTSLIDVVFLLLVFFLLATQLTRESRVEMTLPALDNRESAPLQGESRVIVNVIPSDGTSKPGYAVNKETFSEDAAGIEALAATLRQAHAANAQVKVLVRAARTDTYERVHPVLQAVTMAGVSSVELAAVAPDGEVERLQQREGATP